MIRLNSIPLTPFECIKLQPDLKCFIYIFHVHFFAPIQNKTFVRYFNFHHLQSLIHSLVCMGSLIWWLCMRLWNECDTDLTRLESAISAMIERQVFVLIKPAIKYQAKSRWWRYLFLPDQFEPAHSLLPVSLWIRQRESKLATCPVRPSSTKRISLPLS